MTSFGKKIIGAFLETSTPPASEPAEVPRPGPHPGDANPGDRPDDRFTGHFDKLLSEANIPGPDYYEFARMVAAMQSIPDDGARYKAAFAGLQAQGLDKERLLNTATEYLKILTTDAEQFTATVEASYQEKVRGKETEADQMATRIRSLSQEIMQLQERISALQDEVKASKDKLAGSGSTYTAESKRRQGEIQKDIEKISQYIQ